MNKSVIIGAVVAVVIGVVWFLSYSSDSAPPLRSEQPVQQKSAESMAAPAPVPVERESSPVIDTKTDRMDELTKLFMSYEAGFAYLRHCGELEETLENNPDYMMNAQIVVGALADEMVKEYEDITSENVETAVFSRSRDIQEELEDQYENEGCETQHAIDAKKHFETFSQTAPEEVQSYVNGL